MSFLIMKAIHIIAVISWMAALLYLPRLFVYHASHSQTEETHDMFCLMEKKLIKIIMTPAMFITLITGAAILHIDSTYMNFWWMYVKLIVVVFLIITHRYFVFLYNTFADKKNEKDHQFFRKINELPTIFMVLVVFLIVLKP